jgi:hypothetical protein
MMAICPLLEYKFDQVIKVVLMAGHWWLTSVILATWEAEIGRDTV